MHKILAIIQVRAIRKNSVAHFYINMGTLWLLLVVSNIPRKTVS